MDQHEIPGLDDVRAELAADSSSARPERAPKPALELVELEEPGTWEDRRELDSTDRSQSLMKRLGRLLGRR